MLLTLGLVSICDGVIPQLNLEFSQTMMAAFLTLVGLSTNDTVVVFDRIRENQKIFRSMGLIEVINKSVNETLSRTIITSGTVFVVLTILLFFGGEVIRGFAFASLVGNRDRNVFFHLHRQRHRCRMVRAHEEKSTAHRLIPT